MYMIIAHTYIYIYIPPLYVNMSPLRMPERVAVDITAGFPEYLKWGMSFVIARYLRIRYTCVYV